MERSGNDRGLQEQDASFDPEESYPVDSANALGIMEAGVAYPPR
jgi:hypothetical protein